MRSFRELVLLYWPHESIRKSDYYRPPRRARRGEDLLCPALWQGAWRQRGDGLADLSNYEYVRHGLAWLEEAYPYRGVSFGERGGASQLGLGSAHRRS